MSSVVHEFTAEVPVWKPYVTPVELAQASEVQLDALKVTPSNTKVSDYVLVLAHDVETLKHRTPLFNGVMYGAGGLSRAERELGAVGASIVNRCIYCAAVHASRYNQLTRSTDVIEAIFAAGVDAQIEPRLKTILRFAVKLSKCPSQADAGDMAALVEAGLSKEEILDLILSTSLFGWANRLMHSLGEPIRE
ncbi:peroxidase-related enzyme [Aquamicrobium defluvii]|uniref:Alkylhydroperoxidase n=1 Tax=Aquamicrobium defluvii TaxID=69279 RepID=A0A011SS62_9HYPH|nr:peroxidase-related enzyme [Aquamicrobium defluvii]EXL01984.1 alkylhydroperoxidase [Aquamicrobium defluvii]EZQ13540.1 alkylhydroperoxidase [Halopseudomonas bauzanensis]